MLEIGDRVYYTSGRHDSQESNPLLGTKWECVGTIRTADKIHVSVIWDNGTSNAYLEQDLTHAAELGKTETDPNMAFLRRKIRGRLHHG